MKQARAPNWPGFCLRRGTLLERIKSVPERSMPGKKFRFSLESVLSLRKHETEQARQALGTALTDRKNQEEAVQQAHLTMMEMAREVPATGTTHPASLRRFDTHRHAAQRRHEEACHRLAKLRASEAQARKAVRNRHGAEASLERLRDKEHAEHRQTQEGAAQAFLDEQATSRFHRRGIPATR